MDIDATLLWFKLQLLEITAPLALQRDFAIKTRNDNSDFAERAVGDENWSDITDIIAKAQAHIIAC